MQLYEQDKIDLDKDIKEYLPKGFLTKLAYDTPITMINLMNHTAGWQELTYDIETKEALYRSIYEKAKKSDELLDVLLHYTKLNTSDYQLHFEQQDICRIVRVTVALFYEFLMKNR